jgi:Cys-tRNA synthase (O-phospho-L-seryl-tRNA:Cys-tRNA synthase)
MNQSIISLKQRIDKNYKKLKRRYILVKPILEMINNLIDTKASNQVVYRWLEEYEMSIYCINHHLDLIEQKNTHAK